MSESLRIGDSGERAMPKPCSRELRERVIGAVEAGASCYEAAAAFEVSPSSYAEMKSWLLPG
jgi:transposase